MIQHTPEQAETLRLATDEDMAYVRSIVEDPSVRPTFGPWPEDIENFALFVFGGVVLGAEIRSDWSVYGHIAALPSARGRPALAATRALIDWLFTQTKCRKVCGWTDADNRANIMFNRLIGFRQRGSARDKILFALTREEWEGARCG